MREAADIDRIRRFMRVLGQRSRDQARVYFTGGATAVLYGWRASTIDVDVKFVPERDELYRAIPELKETLRINVELASPADFIPVRLDWEARSPFVTREGPLSFHHFDLSAQVLAKIERGHAQDLEDVREIMRRGLVDRRRLSEYYDAISPELYRYPALVPAAFRRRFVIVIGEVTHNL
jgi:hypothetical protein